MKNNWVSLLALLVSIIALMLSYRVVPVDFKDYWGFVLGVQSLLVTILIGWQIINVFEVKKQIDSFNTTIIDLRKENKRTIDEKIKDYDKTASAIFYQIEGIRYFDKGNGSFALNYFMAALQSLNGSMDQTPLTGIVSYILGIKEDNIVVSPIEKKEIDSYIEIISNSKSLQKQEMIKFVMSLPVKNEKI